MKEGLAKNNQMQEAGEEQLNELIKQAGNEVRARKKEALARHLKMLQAAVDEGVARRKNPLFI
jgi:endonuclease III